MPRTSHLPVECWHQILEDAIFVPLFFDTNPLENYSITIIRRYRDETPYWESERVRNILRRVCSSWNIFLKQYDQRYVQLGHVLLGNAPPEALSKALRITARACMCKLCIKAGGSYSYVQNEPLWWRKIAAADLAVQMNGQTSWRVQILDIMNRSFVEPIVRKPFRLANVEVVLNYEAHLLNGDHFGVMRPLFVESVWNGISESVANASLRHMTSLHLSTPDMSLFKTVSFPNLRHASFWTGPLLTGPECDSMVEWIKLTGHKLVTFFWMGEVAENDRLMRTILRLCPRLEHVQFPRGTIWEHPSQPHQLKYLRLDCEYAEVENCPPCSMCTYPHSPDIIQFQYIVSRLAKAQIPTLSLPEEWRTLLDQKPPFGMGIEAAVCFKSCAESHGLTVLDTLGFTLEQAVVSQLERYLRGDGSGSHFPWIEF
ncbi:SubName: Full=Uncharacterized protein {ECO:0000313/EMBL:CCA71277.1} [Serendipita indica DSM 11827]|uniref:F-box domain-containing protein n=1 Tax=Serendipita indica (strain DSM 11827) TaxID=1109443 RepID=G4TIZ9_SERID|nr:SubName: Full=Uncharacterized protein {ECO:0000313/EMBL:CCA71277.1} [Serendipita indica DSM 11827]CCA71277.1 hypothetical protein PIIN_05216 [Serendipita indica DSM 11827]